eukprot:sb/3462224/
MILFLILFSVATTDNTSTISCQSSTATAGSEGENGTFQIPPEGDFLVLVDLYGIDSTLTLTGNDTELATVEYRSGTWFWMKSTDGRGCWMKTSMLFNRTNGEWIVNFRVNGLYYRNPCTKFSDLKADTISWTGVEKITKCSAPFVQVTKLVNLTNDGVATVECTGEGIPPLKITIGDNTTTQDSALVNFRQEVQPGNVTCLVENTELKLSSSQTVEVPNSLTTTEPPQKVTTQPKKVTTQPRKVTTQPRKETTKPKKETTQPKKETTESLKKETTQPKKVTTQPPKKVTTEPPKKVTTQSKMVTTQPKKLTTQPRKVTTQPPKKVTTQPPKKVTTKDSSVVDLTEINNRLPLVGSEECIAKRDRSYIYQKISLIGSVLSIEIASQGQYVYFYYYESGAKYFGMYLSVKAFNYFEAYLTDYSNGLTDYVSGRVETKISESKSLPTLQLTCLSSTKLATTNSSGHISLFDAEKLCNNRVDVYSSYESETWHCRVPVSLTPTINQLPPFVGNQFPMNCTTTLAMPFQNTTIYQDGAPLASSQNSTVVTMVDYKESSSGQYTCGACHPFLGCFNTVGTMLTIPGVVTPPTNLEYTVGEAQQLTWVIEGYPIYNHTIKCPLPEGYYSKKEEGSDKLQIEVTFVTGRDMITCNSSFAGELTMVASKSKSSFPLVPMLLAVLILAVSVAVLIFAILIVRKRKRKTALVPPKVQISGVTTLPRQEIEMHRGLPIEHTHIMDSTSEWQSTPGGSPSSEWKNGEEEPGYASVEFFGDISAFAASPRDGEDNAIQGTYTTIKELF